jgi:hypothetical protein
LKSDSRLKTVNENGDKMLKRIIPVLLGAALLLSACGPQEAPTMAPADVQNTAVAAAWTMVAATQQAIPTATPLPPTDTPSPTPLPTFTPLPLSTLPQTLPTATQASGTTGECLGPINMGEAGPTVPVRIENQTGGTFTISLTLYLKNDFGQCGALSYAIGKNEKKTVQLPKGSWYAYAWVTVGNKSTTASCSFFLRVGDEDLIRLLVREESCRDTGA